MNWLEVAIETNADGIDGVCDALTALGIVGFEIEDKDDFNTFLEENKKYWDYVDEELYKEKQGATKVKVYIEENAESSEKLTEIKNAMSELKKEGDFGSLAVSYTVRVQEDWENNWRQYFKPIYVGDRIVIKPHWEELQDTEGKLVFEIDPGMTFGSGQHETTRMCVEALEHRVKEDMRIADLGCGSGILGIIALLLGANFVYAADIDENSPRIAYENAALNDVDKSRYKVECRNILSDKKLDEELSKNKFDIVLANIVADVIIPLSEKVRMYMKEEGYFICSGIIDFRKDDVREALLKNGFEIEEEKHDGDWYAFVCR
ncbi:MAG: 50S ribosomal protein L11 methyltransferase [Clostridia bacterium]|nr:50S ribosomal protein L11 methyltransferase [Clostridia bacterium]